MPYIIKLKRLNLNGNSLFVLVNGGDYTLVKVIKSTKAYF